MMFASLLQRFCQLKSTARFGQTRSCACLLLFMLTLAGCGAGTLSGPAVPDSSPLITGSVHGGQQPVSGAKIYLFAVGTGGFTGAPTSLLNAPGYVITTAAGNFDISNDWTCPAAPGDQIYMLAVGGNPGNAGATVNPNLVLMTALGSCSTINASTFINVNEVTTVASAYVLAPFLGYGPGAVTAGTAPRIGVPTSGASCNAAGNWQSTGANTCGYVGLENAMLNVRNLVNVANGTALAGTSTMVAPQAQINLLANILSACVNSTGGSAGDGSRCGTLFQDVPPSAAGLAPTDTLQAIFDLARSPATSAMTSKSLFGLSSAAAAFPTTLTAAPSDWTLYFTLSGGGMNEPTALAIDSKGDVWVVSYNNILSEFTPAGTPVFASGITGSGLHESYGLAIDPYDNIWIANQEVAGGGFYGTLAKFANNGTPLSSGIGYTAGGLNYPQALATAADGSIWVANYGNSSVSHLAQNGSPAPGDCSGGTCGLFAASIRYPDAIAVDANNNAWVGSDTTSTITKISSDGTQFTPVTCCDASYALALDAAGNVWSGNYSNSSVSEVSYAGAVVSAGYTGGGVSYPSSLAVDGAGTIWVSNYLSSTLSELAGAMSSAPGTPLSPSGGFGADANLVDPYAVAVDASGNVWISNAAATAPGGQRGTLTEFVGIAAPVKTPLVGPAQLP